MSHIASGAESRTNLVTVKEIRNLKMSQGLPSPPPGHKWQVSMFNDDLCLSLWTVGLDSREVAYRAFDTVNVSDVACTTRAAAYRILDAFNRGVELSRSLGIPVTFRT